MKVLFLFARFDTVGSSSIDDRLKLLIADAKLRKKMGQVGRKRYEFYFTFNIFEEILSSKN